jgi:hypothetical protein
VSRGAVACRKGCPSGLQRGRRVRPSDPVAGPQPWSASSTHEKGTTVKKIAVRKAGAVRLTSAAASAYCGGTGPVLV